MNLGVFRLPSSAGWKRGHDICGAGIDCLDLTSVYEYFTCPARRVWYQGGAPYYMYHVCTMYVQTYGCIRRQYTKYSVPCPNIRTMVCMHFYHSEQQAVIIAGNRRLARGARTRERSRHGEIEIADCAAAPTGLQVDSPRACARLATTQRVRSGAVTRKPEWARLRVRAHAAT